MRPAVATAPNAAEAAMKAEAARLSAEGAAAAAKEAAAAPPPNPSTTPGTPEFDAAMTASVIVTLVDLVLAMFVSQKLKLNELETAAITAKAEPVIRMYLPPEMFLGPVGALAATAGGIYAAKLMAPDPVPPPSSQTVDSTATPVPPVPATPAGAPGVPS